jgi:hypothetical protein
MRRVTAFIEVEVGAQSTDEAELAAPAGTRGTVVTLATEGQQRRCAQ